MYVNESHTLGKLGLIDKLLSIMFIWYSPNAIVAQLYTIAFKTTIINPMIE